MRTSLTFSRSPAATLLRAAPVRWLASVILVPLLVLGAFRGTSMVAHAHDDHHFHLHAGVSAEAASAFAAMHLQLHEIHPSCCGHDVPPCTEEKSGHDRLDQLLADPASPLAAEDGIVISIPDETQLRQPGIHMHAAGIFAQPVQLLAASTYDLCCGPQIVHSPLLIRSHPPLHLDDVSCSQRLVRTSHALLI